MVPPPPPSSPPPITAPTPRAVDLLIRRAGLPDAFPVSCGIDAERYRAVPKAAADVPTDLAGFMAD